MEAGTIVGIVLQLASCGLVALACGDLLLQWAALVPKRKPRRATEPSATPSFVTVWAGGPERTLAALCGFVLFAAALMVLHIVTGGFLFQARYATLALAAAVLFVWVRQRPAPRPPGSRRAMVLLLVLGAVLLLVYARPALVSGSSIRTGDPPWHLGWTEQILGGDALPTGPAPEFGRNAYPWGLHATMATMVRLAPGTDPVMAFETLHIVVIGALPLAAACIARRLRRDSGWWAAAGTSLIGGFAWLTVDGPDFVTSPGEARYGADLVVASPNSVYELFPSANPREIGLVVLACAAMLLFLSIQSGHRRAEWLAGAIAGAAGLVSVPMFMSALVWIVATAVVRRDARFFGRVMGSALVVFALWALPVVSDQVRYGGFVNITPKLGKEWPLPIALASWGLLLPLAVAGFVVLIRRRTRESGILLALIGGTAFLLILAVARGRFDWGLAGNATLLHQGRVWPPAHLLGGVLAGIALGWLVAWISARRVAVAAASATGLFVVGAASPIVGSLGLTEIMEEGRAGFVYARPDVRDADSFVQRAAEVLRPQDVVLVSGSDDLAFDLFQFAGVRLASYDDPRLPANDLRIRYREPAERWEARMAAGGFEPDLVVTPYEGAASVGGEPPLAVGEYAGETWALFLAPR
ncbi:MAG: hypothetical protein ACRDLB_02200 [Actinomycetota bacterium]